MKFYCVLFFLVGYLKKDLIIVIIQKIIYNKQQAQLYNYLLLCIKSYMNKLIEYWLFSISWVFIVLYVITPGDDQIAKLVLAYSHV